MNKPGPVREDPGTINSTLIPNMKEQNFLRKFNAKAEDFAQSNPWANVARKRKDLEFNFGVGPSAVVDSPHVALLTKSTDPALSASQRKQAQSKIEQIEGLYSSIKKSDSNIKDLMSKIEEQNKQLMKLADDYVQE